MKADDKVKPIQERLAQIEGGTPFRDLREGVGGFANITQQDLMAGLAIVRTFAEVDAIPLAPEILETYFGSTQRYRRDLVRGYLREHRVETQYIPAHRMGATLGAQMMAGASFSSQQDEEFAFICNVRQSTLRDLRASAIRWYQNLLSEATPMFGDALRMVIEERLRERAASLLEGSIRHDEEVRKRKQAAAA